MAGILSCIFPAKLYTYLLFFLFLSNGLEGKRILLLPFTFFSHARQLSIIGESLAEEGHKVYMVLAESFPEKDHFSRGKIKVITSKSVEKDFYTMTEKEFSDFIAAFMSDQDGVKTWRRNFPVFEAMCTNPLADKHLHSTLKSLKFDLALVDIFPAARCLLVIPYNLGVPYVGITTSQEPWVWRNFAPPSAYPINFRGQKYSDKMSFFERADNLWKSLDWAAFPGMGFQADSYISRFIESKEVLTLDQIVRRCLLFLLDTDPLMDYPRPTMPNEIQIGGLGTKPAKPLPNEMKTFMDTQTNGVIVMTFGGANFHLAPHHLKEFLEAFKQINLTVVWKYGEDLQDLPPNVKIYDWLSQNDLFGHSNVKTFITHCGSNGQMEALYHGVPMIGFPVFADQPYNCKRLDAHKFGICLDPETFAAKDLVHAVNKILKDNVYKKNILHASNLFRDRPLSPLKTAVYWINHVMKYGGEHLHAHALDMPWYQILMLDILAFVCTVLFIIMFVVSCIAHKMYSKLMVKKPRLKGE